MKNCIDRLTNYLIFGKELLPESAEDKKYYELEKIIIKILDGNDYLNEEEFNSLINILKTSDAFSDIINVTRIRWNYINSIYNDKGNPEVIFNKAISLTEKKKLIVLKKDILRDLIIFKTNKIKNILDKNLNKEIEKLNNQVEDLNKSGFDSGLYKALIESQNLFEVEFFEQNTKSPYTYRISENLVKTINILIEALIKSVFLGDYSSLHKIRVSIAYSLFNFYKLDNIVSSLHSSLRIFIIENSIFVIKKIFNSEWEYLYPEIKNNPFTFFEFTKNLKRTIQKDTIKCLLIEKLGEYFDSRYLEQLKGFVKYCLETKSSYLSPSDLKLNGFKALRGIINRIAFIEELPRIIKEGISDFWIQDEIIQTLKTIRWERVEENTIEKILQVLFEDLNKFESKRNQIYYIFILIKDNKPLFTEKIDNFMHKCLEIKNSIDEIWYFSNSKYPFKREEAINNVLYILDIINEQNNKMFKGSSIDFGGYSLFGIVAKYLIFNNLEEVFKKVHLIFKKVLLNPYQSTQNKIDCISSVRIIASSNKEELIDFGKRIFEVLRNNKNVMQSRSSFIPVRSVENLELAIFSLHLKLYKPRNLEAIIAKCIEYGMHPSVDLRLDSLKVIITMIEKQKKSLINEILQYIYLKTFDNLYTIRGLAIKYLFHLGVNSKQWDNICFERMNNLLRDPCFFVRNAIISVLEKELKLIRKKPKYISLLHFSENDQHYLIKEKSKYLLKKIKSKGVF